MLNLAFIILCVVSHILGVERDFFPMKESNHCHAWEYDFLLMCYVWLDFYDLDVNAASSLKFSQSFCKGDRPQLEKIKPAVSTRLPRRIS